MKILLIVKGDLRFFYPRIGEEIVRMGHQVEAVTFNALTGERPELRSLDGIHCITPVLRRAMKMSEDWCGERLSRLEAVLAPGCVNQVIYGDRIVRRHPHAFARRLVAGMYEFWRDLLIEAQPDAVIGEIACAAESVGWAISRSLGIPYLMPYASPVTGRFFFIDGPQGLWESMRERHEELVRRGLNPAERERATRFLDEYRRGKIKPDFLRKSLASPAHVDARQARLRVGRIPFRIRTYLREGAFEVGSYDGTSPLEPLAETAARIFRHYVTLRTVFEHELRPGRYAYFPLHFQPEFTTDVRAPYCVNQLALVENIAKSLPQGYELLVKEHPAMKGLRPGWFYRELTRLYNVRLLSPMVDSHDAITASDFVLTITGSTAWEAILYEKPVITFGRTCYGFTDRIRFCENVQQLPVICREVAAITAADREEALRMVEALLSSAHCGSLGNGINDPQVMDPENVARIAAAVINEVERHRVAAVRGSCDLQ